MLMKVLVALACAVCALAMGRTGRAAENPAPAAPAAAQPIARLALVADPHISPSEKYATYVAHFRQVIDEVNAAHVDAVLVAGDLAQSGNPTSLKLFRKLAAGFAAHCWFVAGNHDAGNKVMPDKPAQVTEARMADYTALVGPAWYVQDITPDVRLIGISSTLFGSGLPLEQAQWKFIEQQLAPAAGSAPPKFTLLLSHYPAFVEQPDEAAGYFNMEPASRKRFLALLAGYPGNLLMLTGHLHRPIVTHYHGITDIGAPAVSFGLPEGKQGEGWVLITLLDNGHARFQLHYLNTTGAAPLPQPIQDVAPSQAPAVAGGR